MPESAPPLLQGLAPVVARHTRLVVLGSFPGVASLRAQQYYGHPRNHFWPLLGALWGLDLMALPYARRLQQMLDRGLGLWDVYACCRRPGSLDADIQDAAFNDFAALKRAAPDLMAVAHNGAESARARRHLQALGLVTLRLPSSSPANASWSFQRKLDAWRAAFSEVGL
jgi:hypoxanthine-DNA glycosylase